jgi:hypothetical protein
LDGSTVLMRGLLLALVTVVSTAPPAKPTWPSTFFVNFQEYFLGGGGKAYAGGYALDVDYVDNATGIKGAQIIYRGPTMDESCNAVNPGQACVTLAVAGQRYLMFEDGSPICCRCCSWKVRISALLVYKMEARRLINCKYCFLVYFIEWLRTTDAKVDGKRHVHWEQDRAR